MKLFLAALFLVFSSTSADTATQSDWSGGPGAAGPVTTWGSSFWMESGCQWLRSPGCLGITMGVDHTIDAEFDNALDAHSADIDGDGDIDVLGASYYYHEVVWWENGDGQGTMWTEHVIDGSFGNPQGAYLDDVDGDGDIDVLGASWDLNDVVWWENVDGSGITWIEHPVDLSFNHPCGVRSDDIDGDGDIDVLSMSGYFAEFIWWENADGLGTVWIEHLIDHGYLLPKSVYTDDIDGDGDIDVLGTDSYFSDVVWWENADGLGTTWIEHIIDGEFATALDACSDDIDGDGDIDVLGASHDGDEIAWWENLEGTGDSWMKHTIDPAFGGARSVHSDNMDGDGDVDVIGAAYDDGDIAWWENADGAGATWIKHTVDAAFWGANRAFSDDVNGDGDVDVLGCTFEGDEVIWWDLHGYPGEAYLESSKLYTGCDPDWGTLLWSAETPPGTSVSFRVRASDVYTQMGDWSDTIVSPCSLHGILADNASYIQYRAILTTADSDTTPTLLDVTVTWDPLGTGEGEGPATVELLPFSPNPSSGPVVVSFGLPSATETSFSVFDVSGRVVAQEPAAEYPAGYQQIQLGELPPGIYICRMRAGIFAATQRFVVLD